MRLSMKGDYGVRAVLDLAERAGQGPVQSEAIAKRQGVSEAYLDQLLTLLRRADLVRSVRGPRGGHELARPADEITLMDVLTALEGSFLKVGPDGTQDLPTVRVQQEVWQQVQQQTQKILESTRISHLLERQRAMGSPARYVI
jgi:Rrf2 family cysteine metabolism transcriptional repressor